MRSFLNSCSLSARKTAGIINDFFGEIMLSHFLKIRFFVSFLFLSQKCAASSLDNSFQNLTKFSPFDENKTEFIKLLKQDEFSSGNKSVNKILLTSDTVETVEWDSLF
jgi:hypothetical protein